MSMRRIAIAGILMVLAVGAQADVLLGHANEAGSASKTWTVSDLNFTPPSISGDNAPWASNTFTLASSIGGSESFSIVRTAATNWSASAAQTAIAGGTLPAYIAGLDAGDVDSTADAFYATPTGNDNKGFLVLGEVMFIEFDTDNLTSGSLVLKEISFSKYTVGDRTDFLIYDASANAVVHQGWDVNYNPSDAVTGDWTLETGDMAILAVGASQGLTDDWRQLTMTVDIIPEPTTLLLISVFGGAMLLFRRRFRV